MIESEQHFSKRSSSSLPQGELLVLGATTASREIVVLRRKARSMTGRWFEEGSAAATGSTPAEFLNSVFRLQQQRSQMTAQGLRRFDCWTELTRIYHLRFFSSSKHLSRSCKILQLHVLVFFFFLINSYDLLSIAGQ